ncbi:MAG: hypothetical protein K6A33_13200 [Clostridiales bacterium]|nr:hypothetical protein [Clostridiales bacterium]
MKPDNLHPTAGATERTPSRPQYFSWVNSTNEGSTEAQTLANLGYFAWLRRAYNMRLEIYAWDAGNLDGASGTYETFDSPKLKAQYPHGYGPLAEAAAEIGCRLGVWCGPDGFGSTPEEHAARRELMVSLCRDYRFALFKIDGVCGQLSPEHRDLFVDMMTECRRYSPDLILLNHRLYLGEEGMKHATTFLWNGEEMYTDVHIVNRGTAPHHRAYFMDRGNTPGLARLAEDHGVCISSCIDYFEDDLIFQAFGRSLILAPEIYGNPWLMRDDEHAHLARIYNLHRRWRDILVTGMLLPGGDRYPKNAVARGSASHRFLTVGCDTWKPGKLKMTLDMEIGLAPCEKVAVILRHPYEKYVGEFDYGEVVELPLPAFRATLVEVCDSREADPMPAGCAFEVLHEDEDGHIDHIRVVSSDGNVRWTDGRPFADIPAFDSTLRDPVDLGTLPADAFVPVPPDAERQLETALFSENQDSLEARALARSGETAIPEVKAARDAFFAQRTYVLRGPESRFAFDGDPGTFFDGISRTFHSGYGIGNKCLRVDFGGIVEADAVTVEFFDPAEEIVHRTRSGGTCRIPRQDIPPHGDFSADLAAWRKTYLEEIVNGPAVTEDFLVEGVNNIIEGRGRHRTAVYPVEGGIRYFRLPAPPERIYKIALLKDGIEQPLPAPHVNNLLPAGRAVKYAKEMTVTVPSEDIRPGCYLAVGLEGEHGTEGAYAILDTGDGLLAAYDRAPGYLSNIWECRARAVSHHYTYYFAITPELGGKPLTVRILGLDDAHRDYAVSVHLCDAKRPAEGPVFTL